MSIEGELVVRYESRGGHVTAVATRCERPRVAARIFGGRRAREAAPLCGSIFSICGRAQGVAAQAAADAALGEDSGGRERRERDVRLETLQEHAWRIFVDAPRQLGREPAIEVVAALRHAIAADTSIAWSRDFLLGWSPARFLALDSLAGLREWMNEVATPAASICGSLMKDDPALGASDVPLLDRGRDDWIGAALVPALQSDERYDEHPNLSGAARETGALSRMASHPLASDAIEAWGRGVGSRLAARLLELASLLSSTQDETRHGSIRASDGTGVGWVETARGLLVHAVTLDDGHIADYRIVAPTEWNFHPDGAFTRGALGVRAKSRGELDQRIGRLAASLDPCVGIRYEALHA